MKILPELFGTNVSDLHIFPGETCFIRRDGILEPLMGVSFSEKEVKEIILKTGSNRAREILGRSRQVNYSCKFPRIGRLRFSAYYDKDKFALAIRLLAAKVPEFSEIGLPEALKKVFSHPSGLVIVGSPSGNGKTTTIASILNFFNSHFEKCVMTVENPVEIEFRDQRCSFIQRSIPLDIQNFYVGLKEAYRLEPDVVMTDSVNYVDTLDQSLLLCESGRFVIGAADGGSCQQIIERAIHARPEKDRESFRARLALHLTAIISQRLVRRSDGKGRIAVFDILVNTSQVRKLIKNENLVMLKSLQEQDQLSGMQSFDQHLTALVRKSVVSPSDAAEIADDGREMSVRFGRK